MKRFLLDTWDVSRREVQKHGYSAVLPVGSFDLGDLPRCPLCGRGVWAKVVLEAKKIKFTGKRIGDIAYGFSACYIVSNRFRLAWIEADLKGLTFSDTPVRCSFRKGAVFLSGTDEFFFAYPEPRIARLASEAGAVFGVFPRCKLCDSGEVISLERLAFEPVGLEDTDFCLPSCLTGWTLVSERFVELVYFRRLLNFQFIEGFIWDERRNLIRLRCLVQDEKGRFTRHECWSYQ
ncbi:MAG TPA: hypothetical protein PLP42_03085 [Acidobacteriota bacterium]|nr:hypothetical protein [Acidobacteriota bacterium]